MKCFVTGASGFIGANLVHALNARGHEVRALLRPGCSRLGLAGADYEPIEGDLSDGDKLKNYARGCDWCFHVAANYHLWLRNYALMYETNVEGTRRMLEAAAAAGCSRIVHTSTVGCIGLPDSRNGTVKPTDETAPVSEGQMSNDYKRSKWRAEQVALDLARKGLPIVVVNPSAPIGPRDSKPTPTGKVIVDFLNRRLPAFLDTGWNWVHVQDVAAGHILAAERGRIGERYVLGHAQGNWTMLEAFRVLEKLSGVPAPTFRAPYWTALLAAHVNEAVSAVTAREPVAPLGGVRMARFKMFYSPAKAICELGLPQTPPQQAVQDAIDWFRGNSFVRP
jgi:dihydroflavonol-4-reductase